MKEDYEEKAFGILRANKLYKNMKDTDANKKNLKWVTYTWKETREIIIDITCRLLFHPKKKEGKY